MSSRLSTNKCILWDWVFISPWLGRCIHPKIELLPQKLPCPVLRPYVPHSHIVQCHVDCSPWPWIHLCSINKINLCYLLKKQQQLSTSLIICCIISYVVYLTLINQIGHFVIYLGGASINSTFQIVGSSACRCPLSNTIPNSSTRVKHYS